MTVDPDSEAMRVVKRNRSLKKKKFIFFLEGVRVIVSLSVQILLQIKKNQQCTVRV